MGDVLPSCMEFQLFGATSGCKCELFGTSIFRSIEWFDGPERALRLVEGRHVGYDNVRPPSSLGQLPETELTSFVWIRDQGGRSCRGNGMCQKRSFTSSKKRSLLLIRQALEETL